MRSFGAALLLVSFRFAAVGSVDAALPKAVSTGTDEGNLVLSSRVQLHGAEHRVRRELMRRAEPAGGGADASLRHQDHGTGSSLIAQTARQEGAASAATAAAAEASSRQQQEEAEKEEKSKPDDSGELRVENCKTGPDAQPGSPKVANYKIKLANLDPKLAALGDRLVKLADGREAMRVCGSFFCYGDYCWCNKVMPAETNFARLNPFKGAFCNVTGSRALDLRANFQDHREQNNNQFEGLSYGIDDTDGWSELMSSQYHLVTRLYDCYVRSGLGPMFTDMHGSFTRENPCKTTGCYTTPYQYHRICVNNVSKVEDGYQFETMKHHLSGRQKLSTHVKLDVEGHEFPILDNLLSDEEEVKKIRTLDLEIHTTFGGSLGYDYERRVDVLERMAKRFVVTGSSIEPMFRAAYNENQAQTKANPKFVQQPFDIYTSAGMPLVQYVMSFANRDLFNAADLMPI